MASLRRALPAAVAVARAQLPAVDASAGTLAAWYYKSIREFETPTKDALVAPGQDVKFNIGDLDKHVYAYARGFLDALDINKGDRVVLYAGSEVESLVIQYAAALAGATVVIVDPAVPAAALLDIVKTEQAKVLFFAPRFGGDARVAKIQETFKEELEPFTYGASVGYEPIKSKRLLSLRWIVQIGFEPIEGVVRLKDLPVYGDDGSYSHDEIAVAQHRVSAKDASTTYYSASADGSVRKTSSLSHADILAKATAASKALKLASKDVVTVTAPLYQQFGFAAGALAAAATQAKTVLPSKVFDAAKTLQAITAQRSTVLVASKEHVAALNAELQSDASKPAEKRQYDLSSLRGGLVAGGDDKVGTVALTGFA